MHKVRKDKGSMSEEEKEAFLDNVYYFWFEKGDCERLVGFSIEKLKEADPVLGEAYEKMRIADKTFSRLLKERV